MGSVGGSGEPRDVHDRQRLLTRHLGEEVMSSRERLPTLDAGE
jgi:hypothetical protein